MIINIESVCNLSRIPVALIDNPLAKTCSQIIKDDSISYQETFLYKHYMCQKDNSLSSFYNLDIENLKNFSCYDSFLPWYHVEPVTKFIDHAFLKQNDDYIKRQIEKTKILCDSIQSLGYVPEKFSSSDRKKGQITGYFLKYKNVKRFYVVSGNHRVSSCYAIFGKKNKIQVDNEKFKYMKSRDKENCCFLNLPDYPKEFNVSNLLTWPSVKRGFLKPNEAEEIFKKYIFA